MYCRVCFESMHSGNVQTILRGRFSLLESYLKMMQQRENIKIPRGCLDKSEEPGAAARGPLGGPAPAGAGAAESGAELTKERSRGGGTAPGTARGQFFVVLCAVRPAGPAQHVPVPVPAPLAVFTTARRPMAAYGGPA